MIHTCVNTTCMELVVITVSLQRRFFIARMLLEGVNFEEFDGKGAGNTPSAKKEGRRLEGRRKRRRKRRRRRIRRKMTRKRSAGEEGRWNRGGRHVENVSQPPYSLVYIHHCQF